MLPYFAFALAVIFVVLKASGAWDEFTAAMRNLQRFQGKQKSSDNDTFEEADVNRLEVFREFLEGPADDDRDDSPGS